MATRTDLQAPKKQRIIVDCTHTYRSGLGTGIQRVVRCLASELVKLGREECVSVIPVALCCGQVLALPSGSNGSVEFARSAQARDETPLLQHAALHRWRQYTLRASRILHSRQLDAWAWAGINETGLERWLGELDWADDLELARVTLDAQDVVVSLDSSWVYDIRTTLEAAQRVGADSHVFVHDVLPITNPEWFTEGTPRLFRGWVEMFLGRASGVIGNSQATLDALTRVATEFGWPLRDGQRQCVAHLGADFHDHSLAPPVRPQLAALANGAPLLITVGTLEPRKNVGYALDLFDRLVAADGSLRWLIVGSEGWMEEHTATRVRRHAALGRQLFWFEDLTDRELHWLYSNATALVALSKFEGFGLPLVEARLGGASVVASDISVFREVLGDEGLYVPLGKPDLAVVVLKDLLAGRFKAPNPSRVASTWRKAAKTIFDHVLAP